jgi:hypothetical protein
VDSLLVSLSGDVATERIRGFVDEVVGDRDIGVTLYSAAEEGDGAEERLGATAEIA